MAKKEKEVEQEVVTEITTVHSKDEHGRPIMPITDTVGVIVMGKDERRAAAVADVIYGQLGELGLFAVRHTFHDVGKSHAIPVDGLSVLDAISKKDPILFSTGIVVAHDNIGHRLTVPKETELPRFPNVKDLGRYSGMEAMKHVAPNEEEMVKLSMDQKFIEVVAEAEINLCDAVTEVLMDTVSDLREVVPPHMRAFATGSTLDYLRSGESINVGFARAYDANATILRLDNQSAEANKALAAARDSLDKAKEPDAIAKLEECIRQMEVLYNENRSMDETLDKLLELAKQLPRGNGIVHRGFHIINDENGPEARWSSGDFQVTRF